LRLGDGARTRCPPISNTGNRAGDDSACDSGFDDGDDDDAYMLNPASCNDNADRVCDARPDVGDERMVPIAVLFGRWMLSEVEEDECDEGDARSDEVDAERSIIVDAPLRLSAEVERPFHCESTSFSS